MPVVTAGNLVARSLKLQRWSTAVKTCEMYTLLNLGVFLRNFRRFKKALTTSGELKDTRAGRGMATISLVLPRLFHRKRPWRHLHCSQLSYQGHRKRHFLNRTEIRQRIQAIQL